MKKYIALIIVIIMCLGLASCRESEEQFVPKNETFTVMSFNIRILGLEDREDKFWINRKEDVISLVLRHDPDIIGFQEVKDPQYEYLRENLTNYDYFGINSWSDDEYASFMGGANAVFYKRDRFEAISTRTLWLSDTPLVRSAWEGVDFRTLSELKLKDKLSGEIFTFINTHLAVTKLGQQKATQLLKEIARETQGGLIVTGDFNFQQGTADYLIMTDETLKDAMTLAPETDSGGTFHSFNGTIDRPWPKPIDFIFLTDDYFTPLSYKIVRDKNEQGKYPSDHFPVKAVISYKEA